MQGTDELSGSCDPKPSIITNAKLLMYIFLSFRDGDQLNFFRVVDRGDGTLTPLSDSLR